MSEGKTKKDMFYFIVLILTMITMIIGITFTYFNLLASEKEDSTIIKTGTLSINYVDGKIFNTYTLLPIDEPSLNTKYSVVKKEFYVSSDGTLDQTLDLYLKVTRNDFTEGALKFVIYNSSNRKMATGYIPITGEKVLMSSGIFLKNNETEKFTVLIWLQENNQNQDHEQGNIFVGGFDITATQMIYE